MFYTLYCSKFSTSTASIESASSGIESLIQEVEDWLTESEGAFRSMKRQRSSDIWSVLRIIFAIFAVVLSALYYTGVYFALFEE